MPQIWKVPQTNTFIDFKQFTEPLVNSEADYVLFKASQEVLEFLKTHGPQERFLEGRYQKTYHDVLLRIDESSMITRAGPYFTYQDLRDTVSGLSTFFNTRTDRHIFECSFNVKVRRRNQDGIPRLFKVAQGIFYQTFYDEEQIFETS